ncbi:T9SS type A sorting domain-containing protein [uncultured Draconibacterium sp.]|uniref:T9SS type A sorting domain-containing protein n=1 Tax=uncultured Draconibacterium sp. TaxID=1573823 RepID=UPI0025F6F8B2|nr:T9SS type A sorting domain-containing protein [uncultured Draconibacterium sp.]
MKNIKLVLLLVCSPLFTLAQNYPLSDPNNTGGWILNEHMSDEFNGTELDREKWWILGEEVNGTREYRNKWKGRAPGQFVGHNVFMEDGELVLRSQWEPEFSFVKEKNNNVYYGGTETAADNSYPITQACILSEGMFKYGYIEARYKAADAPVTNAFWTTGYRSEIDMTENFGKRPIANPANKPESLERLFRTNIISWEPNLPADHKNWKVYKDMGVRLAEDYHVFGFEWDKDYIKTYFNGELVQSITRQELESWEYATGKFHNQWVIKHAMELWMDAEVFSWYGLPEAADLAEPADHRYDYIRIWQKEIAGPEFYALGFEGPFYYKYGDMEHKRSQNWWAPNSSPFLLTDEKAASGDGCLAYKQTTTINTNQTIYAPYGTLNLPAGNNKLRFKVWKEPGTNIDKINFILRNPYLEFQKDISSIETGKWVELSVDFNRGASLFTGDADRLEIQIKSADVSGVENTLYIDDMGFDKDNNVSDPPTSSEIIRQNSEIELYPNPAKNRVNIRSANATKFSIFNLQGVVVKQEVKRTEPQLVDLSSLPTGMYIVSVQSNNTIINKKLQVSR